MKYIRQIPNIGDQRTIEKFLWFPVIIEKRDEKHEYFETRWLTKAKILQEYQGDYKKDSWTNIKFKD